MFDILLFINAAFISIYAVLINADAAKIPAYGTTVLFNQHLYRKGSKCFLKPINLCSKVSNLCSKV